MRIFFSQLSVTNRFGGTTGGLFYLDARYIENFKWPNKWYRVNKTIRFQLLQFSAASSPSMTRRFFNGLRRILIPTTFDLGRVDIADRTYSITEKTLWDHFLRRVSWSFRDAFWKSVHKTIVFKLGYNAASHPFDFSMSCIADRLQNLADRVLIRALL